MFPRTGKRSKTVMIYSHRRAKQLAAAGYSEDGLSADVINNIAFARANMKMNIYAQAVLESVATTFPQEV